MTAFRVGVDGLVAPLPTATPTLPQPLYPGVNGVAAAQGAVLDPNFRPNAVDTFTFTFQRQLSNKISMEIGYIGRLIHHDFLPINPNAVPYIMTKGGQTFAKAYANTLIAYCGNGDPKNMGGGNCIGNAAAVCPLEAWLPDEVMQAIAAENNLSETAFFVAEGAGYRLRWFTPVAEVDLCGHATLASAHVIFRFLRPELREIAFETQQAGILTVTRDGDLLALDFPSRPPSPCAAPTGLAAALGPTAVLLRDYLAVYRRSRHRGADPGFRSDHRARPVRGHRHRPGLAMSISCRGSSPRQKRQ